MDSSKHFEPWPALGLAFRDAIRRLTSNSLWESASLPVKKAMVRVPQRTGWVSAGRDLGIGGRFQSVDLNESERKDANSKAKTAFYEALSTGAVVALGHEDESAAMKLERQGQPAPAIAPKEWAVLQIVGDSGSKAKQRKIVVYHSLRFLPLLHSSLATETLAGLTLQEAFTRFVAGDPELIAVCEAEDLEPLVVAFSEVAGNSVAHAIAGQRKQALLGLLKTGALVAHGVDASGKAMALEPSRWGAEGGAVDWGSDVQLRLPGISHDVPPAPTSEKWALLPLETGKAFVSRFFGSILPYDLGPESIIENAGGVVAFSKMVAANSAAATSDDKIRKPLKAQLDDRAKKRQNSRSKTA